jgi:hypothetical protein
MVVHGARRNTETEKEKMKKKKVIRPEENVKV